MPESPAVSACCGRCGGNVFMATCDSFRGSGHEWVIVGICMICRNVAWSEEGCLDCRASDPPLPPPDEGGR